MNIPDLIFENSFFWLKIHKLFDADPDSGFGILSTLNPRSGMEKSDLGFRIQDKHPGSATL
jgi:hypothetical protein